MEKPTEKTNDKNFVSLQDIYNEYATKATKEKAHNVDIVKRYKVEFVKDFLNINKGHKQEVSKVMYDWYNANKAIKEVKED